MRPFAARRLFFLAVFALLLAAPIAPAQTWTGAVDNNWTNTGNWDTNTVPGSGNAATFNGAGNGNTNISLGATAQPINTIQFMTASAAAYNLGVLGSGDQFNFDANGVISVDAAVANLETINAVVATAGDLKVDVANSAVPASNLGLKLEGGMSLAPGFLTFSGTGAITVDRPITGSGFVQIDLKAGALNLNAPNTYTGDTYFLANATGGQQPAIRIGVDSVGSPGAVVSGPFGTGKFIPQSTNPPVLQAIGGDRTIANDIQFDRGIFLGTINTAPLPVGETAHNLTFTGTLSTPGRVLTNNLPAGVALYLGSATVTNPFTLGGVLSFQSQNATSGNGGGVTIVNDPLTGASGGLTVQNSAIAILNNANNDYGGATTITTSANYVGITPVPSNATILVNGAKTGTGAVNINTRCNANLVCSAAAATAISGVGVLGGTGSVAGNVTNGGIIAPGAVAGTPGTLTLTGNLTDASTTTPVAAPSHWAIELNGTAVPTYTVSSRRSTAPMMQTRLMPFGIVANDNSFFMTSGERLTC